MILEIRTYRVFPGALETFVKEMRATFPLLQAHGIDVVAAGASEVHEPGEHAYLIRAFASLAERDRLERRFYASSGWRDGPRYRILSLIEEYHTVVVPVGTTDVRALQALFSV